MHHYSGLCEVVTVKGPILTLCELDTRREFTANHDAVRLLSLSLGRLPEAAPAPPDPDGRAPLQPPDVDLDEHFQHPQLSADDRC